MIMSISEARTYIDTAEPDAILESKLKAIELLIRKYTNNNFKLRSFRSNCSVSSGNLQYASTMFAVNDTVEISESRFNNGIYTVKHIDFDNGCTEVDASLYDENSVLVTKVLYPSDIKMGAVNMLKWDFENRDKVGISSETISRHSVTYFNMDGENSLVGYPKSLVGFLEPYKKARF